MKGILALLRAKIGPAARPDEDTTDTTLFASAFAGQGVNPSLLMPWDARAVEIGAARMSPSQGVKMMQKLWIKDRFMSQLDGKAVLSLQRFFEFASVPSGRDVIRQDEYGNYMMVLLAGTMHIDRRQPWGENLRLAESHPGDILGEMSLLDSGIRFSSCTTITDCKIAILSASAMDEMMEAEPLLAASLVALLARKLSLRLRAVSARLSDPGVTP
jgi:hypothetical protein